MCGEQRVLDGVGGLLAVADGAQGDGPQPVAMAADQLGEGVRVTVDVRAQQIRVARLGGTGGSHASNLAEWCDGPGAAQYPYTSMLLTLTRYLPSSARGSSDSHSRMYWC